MSGWTPVTEDTLKAKAPAGWTPVEEEKAPSKYGEGTIVNNRFEGAVAKSLSGAGLPTSLANIPEWLSNLRNLNISHLFIEPVKKAVDNPTQENIVGAVPFIGPTSVSMAQDVREGHPEEALGTLAGSIAALKGAGKTPEAARATADAASAARENIGAAIHDEEGNLKLGVKAGSKIAGGLAGGVVGGVVGHEYLGAAAGYKAGPSLMESIFPEPASAAEARAQAELYQSKADDLMRRGKEQEALDRKAGKLKGNETPFEGAAKNPSGKIVSPDSPAPDLKTTYQSYPRAQLYSMALKGDVEALRELVRNPGGYPLPPNAKFLLEDAGRKPWRNPDK